MGNYVVVESFVKGKSEVISCEDRIVITPYYCAVIDGATSKTPMNILNLTPGFWAAELIKQSIIDLPYDCPLKMVTELITEKIRSCYIKYGLEDDVCQHPENRFSASAAIFSVCYNEVWLIGDCQCRINGITYKNEKLVDRIFSEVRSYVNRTELLRGKTIEELQKKDVGREYILPLLKKQVIWQNSEVDSLYTYPVLDGFPVLLSKVRVISVPKCAQIVLASDGYPVLCDDLRETEKVLFDILERDPLCIEEYLSTKGVARMNDSFDDRAYLRLQL
ncbi:hypothetical protein [Coprobacter secundus]|uniref:Uncharacterized protein n=1 Tax=Coprobacter secundus subsp. similis TaxID=2751153 RepID=A0A7G1HY95_9BACT|nr:hypothetical protein [Coprobacter secundus]BCI64626.1 hypothetical protein Cop2CBH44_29790 [Coprobacter secundus subsp. similis]